MSREWAACSDSEKPMDAVAKTHQRTPPSQGAHVGGRPGRERLRVLEGRIGTLGGRPYSLRRRRKGPRLQGVPGALQDDSGAPQDAASPFCYCQPRAEEMPMHRRAFLTLLGGAAAWPLAASAQQPPSVSLIGVLSPVSAAAAARYVEALREGLRGRGYEEGRNIVIEFRFADGMPGRLPDLAAELVRLRPAVIIAGSAPGALAAGNATRTIPVLFTQNQDPMALGLVHSMARPGGNVTGFWSEGDEGLIGKRLELLKEAVPSVSEVGFIVNPEDTADANALSSLPAVSHALGLGVRVLECEQRQSSRWLSPLQRANACRRCTSANLRCSTATAARSPRWR